MDQMTYCKGFHDDDAVAKMTYNALGNTGMSVSALSLGKMPGTSVLELNDSMSLHSNFSI